MYCTVKVSTPDSMNDGLYSRRRPGLRKCVKSIRSVVPPAPEMFVTSAISMKVPASPVSTATQVTSLCD